MVLKKLHHSKSLWMSGQRNLTEQILGHKTLWQSTSPKPNFHVLMKMYGPQKDLLWQMFARRALSVKN